MVAFVVPAAILPVICTANLMPLRLKCAPDKSSFEGLFSPNTSPYPSVSTRVRKPPPLNVNAQNGGIGLSGVGKR